MRDLNRDEISRVLSTLLNINGETSWVDLEGIFTLPQGSLADPATVTINVNQVLVLKVFANSRTGEVRYYLIKLITGEE